jgi:hypothetical protein
MGNSVTCLLIAVIGAIIAASSRLVAALSLIAAAFCGASGMMLRLCVISRGGFALMRVRRKCWRLGVMTGKAAVRCAKRDAAAFPSREAAF